MTLCVRLAAASRNVVTPLRSVRAVRGPSRNLRAVYGKVLVRKQGTHLFVGEKLGQKLACHLGLEQPVAVLREHGRHPHWIIHTQSTTRETYWSTCRQPL